MLEKMHLSDSDPKNPTVVNHDLEKKLSMDSFKKSFCVIFVDLQLLKKKPLINIFRQYMKEALLV